MEDDVIHDSLLLIDPSPIRYAIRKNKPTEPSDPALSASADSRGNALSKTVLRLGAALPRIYLDYILALLGSSRLPQSTLSLHLEPWESYAALVGALSRLTRNWQKLAVLCIATIVALLPFSDGGIHDGPSALSYYTYV